MKAEVYATSLVSTNFNSVNVTVGKGRTLDMCKCNDNRIAQENKYSSIRNSYRHSK